MTLSELFNQAVHCRQNHDPDRAQSLCQDILAQCPEQPTALNLLAILAAESGDRPAALSFLARAAAADPTEPEYLCNFARLAYQMGRWTDAAAAYRGAFRARPNDPAIYNDLGLSLAALGQLDQAMAVYRQGLAIEPSDFRLLCNLGTALHDTGRQTLALDFFRRSVAVQPDNADAHNNLGTALGIAGLTDESAAACRRALELKPDMAIAQNNLGQALFFTGQIDAAIAAYRHAVLIKPDYDDAASNVLFALNFHPGYDAPAILRHARLWDQKFARPLSHLIQPHKNDRSPDRPLRIGYHSPNFWAHSQAPFIYPLLREHDRRQFEIFCYSDVLHADAVTAMLRACPVVWRNCVGLSDPDVADMIRADAIDVLVDLTMHMARARPQVFAQKPAPIQVAWLAYPGTTGLSAMDYRFTDVHLDPPGETDACYAEISVRLPDTFACFDPAMMEPPPPLSPLPARRNGHITFGSLNNFFKINVPLLKLWRRALDAVPNSRLRLLAPEGSARQWILETLPPAQVDFISRQSRPGYLAELARLDIALDTLPYNGHTTTLDALWLGVPIVTRLGHTAAGRAAASVLRNLGLPELIAPDDDQFVTLAAALAAHLDRLAALRQTLRARMTASPLLDARRFAANVEAAYRQMWHDYLRTTGDQT